MIDRSGGADGYGQRRYAGAEPCRRRFLDNFSGFGLFWVAADFPMLVRRCVSG
jgi:hypothetical protein